MNDGALAVWIGEFHAIMEHFAETGGNRSHLRLNPHRQRSSSFLQPLENPLAHEIEVSAFLEDGRDLREAVARERPGAFYAIKPRQSGFNRISNPLFYFNRRKGGRQCVDLHLFIGDVRRHVDRQ